MLLYHGTTEEIAKRVMKEGLLTRNQLRKMGRRASGNWKHTVQSHPDRIYLTDTYPLYFSAANIKSTKKVAVIEIETDVLDQTKLLADEDVLEQVFRGKDGLDLPVKKRTEYYRDEVYSNEWEKSLSIMGTCSHEGSIPKEAIRRICIIDPDHPCLAVAMDASISIQNYRFCSQKYKILTAWVFGDVEEVVPDYSVSSLLKMSENDKIMSFGTSIALPRRSEQKGIKIINGRKE